MNATNFNLVTDPWIKVIDQYNNTQTVSLITLFQDASKFKQLAGEMKSQDLAILRFLLAILTTVYTRFDYDDQVYDWLELDDKYQVEDVDEDEYEDGGKDDLFQTWSDLYDSKKFSPSVFNYLKKYQDKFDFFGNDPFYQVTKNEYNSLVPANKQTSHGKGTVAIKQINRTISESNNTPDIFAPKTDQYKNKISIDELVRWIITYQNFTGVTDKTKVQSSEKFSVSKGWLYGLNPVFVKGQNLFQTLIFNLKLLDLSNCSKQKPVWEWKSKTDYIKYRIKAEVPDNISDLYTSWARSLHIEWKEGIPIIFSAGLPKINDQGAFVEPMTTWSFSEKDNAYRPNQKWIKSIGESMWRNFGQYVRIDHNDKGKKPGILEWLDNLKENNDLSVDATLNLATVGLISDGNATSQSPIAEVYDNMQINADVLFDENKEKALYWPSRIEDQINLTKTIANIYWNFIKNIGVLRDLDNPAGFATKNSNELYDKFNQPFLNWLASLTNDQERDPKVKEWKMTLQRIVLSQANDFIHSATPRDIRGNGNNNIFDYYRIFRASVFKVLREG